MSKYRELYLPIAGIMKENAFGDWESCVNEHIIRAVTARLQLTHDGCDFYSKTLEQERTKGTLTTFARTCPCMKRTGVMHLDLN